MKRRKPSSSESAEFGTAWSLGRSDVQSSFLSCFNRRLQRDISRGVLESLLSPCPGLQACVHNEKIVYVQTNKLLASDTGDMWLEVVPGPLPLACILVVIVESDCAVTPMPPDRAGRQRKGARGHVRFRVRVRIGLEAKKDTPYLGP